MDQTSQYGQENFNLPHDVVKLPSKGIFYRPKKESLKVGYLTASDENVLMSQNDTKDGIVTTLLRTKIYEPGFDVTQMIDTDVQAILLFLRNTSFGPEYHVKVNDPATNKTFEVSLLIDQVDYINSMYNPDEEGLFSYTLPKSGNQVKLKILSIGEQKEVENLVDSYPKGVIAPTITKRLEKHIIEIDGDADRMKISTFVNQMPISDSKDLRTFLKECEPSIDLNRTVTAPSGEKVTFELSFGVEFFRPFFSI